jgi:hypothetical protein
MYTRSLPVMRDRHFVGMAALVSHQKCYPVG